MKQNVQFTCRGCREVAMDDAVSLLSPGIRELYEKCTYIAVGLFTCVKEMDILP